MKFHSSIRTGLSGTDITGFFCEIVRCRKLQTSDAVIVLLTEGAAESPWVVFEIGAALGLGKRILPVLMGDLDHDKIDYLIRDQRYLDARLLNPTQTAKEII